MPECRNFCVYFLLREVAQVGARREFQAWGNLLHPSYSILQSLAQGISACAKFKHGEDFKWHFGNTAERPTVSTALIQHLTAIALD